MAYMMFLGGANQVHTRGIKYSKHESTHLGCQFIQSWVSIGLQLSSACIEKAADCFQSNLQRTELKGRFWYSHNKIAGHEHIVHKYN